MKQLERFLGYAADLAAICSGDVFVDTRICPEYENDVDEAVTLASKISKLAERVQRQAAKAMAQAQRPAIPRGYVAVPRSVLKALEDNWERGDLAGAVQEAVAYL
jgi:hypothetical protein